MIVNGLRARHLLLIAEWRIWARPPFRFVLQCGGIVIAGITDALAPSIAPYFFLTISFAKSRFD
jgi:hypothetical protein